jgi:hypothetical protein
MRVKSAQPGVGVGEARPPPFTLSIPTQADAPAKRADTLTLFPLYPKLWIEKTNDLVDIETEISGNLKGLGAIVIATAVSLAGFETAIWFFETQPHREREPDR